MLVVGTAAWLYTRPSRRASLAWLLPAFGDALLPALNFIRISLPADMGFPMAERFLYLPSVFFYIGVAALLEESLASPPARWTVIGLLAVTLGLRTAARNNDWRNEETFFRICLQTAPHALLLHANLAAHLLETGQTEKAVLEYQRAIQTNYEQTSLFSAFLQNNLAAAYRMAGRHAEALSILAKLPRAFDYPAVHFNRAVSLAALGHANEVEQAFRHALKRDPYHLESLIGLAQLLQSQRRWSEAAKYYRLAASLFPDEPTLFNAWGVALKNAGRIEEAVAAFTKATRMAPDNFEFRGNLGVAWAIQGDLPAAETELRMAIDLNPRHWDAWLALGTLYATKRQLAEAERCFDMVLASAPTNAEALINKGILRFQQGETNEAQAFFQQALENAPDNQRARAYLRQLQGLSARAERQ